MKLSTLKRRALPVVTAGIFAVVQVAVGVSPAQAEDGKFAFQANAYGSLVEVNDKLVSGKTAFASIGCTTTPGSHSENNTASVKLGNVGSLGVTVSSADAVVDGGVSASRASSEVATISLLGGLIKADALTAKSESRAFPFANSGSSVFVNLKIGSQSFGSTPEPNTKVTLNGLGYVILNEQMPWAGSTGASMQVNALHIVITQTNPLNIKISTNAIIGHAQTSLSGPVAGVMDGFAFGTTEETGDIVSSGRTAYQSLGCTGTGGNPKTNTIATVSIPGLKSGTVTSTVSGLVKSTVITGETQNTIQSVNLLDGLITADLIKARVSGSRSGGVTTFTDGSQFVNLKISGHPEIADDVAPNTTITLAGVGTLTLHKVVKTGTDSLEVRMIELVIDVPDAPLPLGTLVRVSDAKLQLFG